MCRQILRPAVREHCRRMPVAFQLMRQLSNEFFHTAEVWMEITRKQRNLHDALTVLALRGRCRISSAYTRLVLPHDRLPGKHLAPHQPHRPHVFPPSRILQQPQNRPAQFLRIHDHPVLPMTQNLQRSHVRRRHHRRSRSQRLNVRDPKSFITARQTKHPRPPIQLRQRLQLHISPHVHALRRQLALATPSTTELPA